MKTGPSHSRLLAALCTALVIAVALVVAIGVVPQVRVAEVPDISPDSAVPAFWLSVVLHLLAALAIALTTTLSKSRSKSSTSIFVITGVAILLMGFILSDAALAFHEAGPTMQTVATLLLLCVAADVLAGALTIAAAFTLPTEGSIRASS